MSRRVFTLAIGALGVCALARVAAQPLRAPRLSAVVLTQPEFAGTLSRPIPFPGARARLTLEYIRSRYDSGADDITIVPRVIVIHWTGSSTAQSAIAAFSPTTLPAWRPEIARGGRVNVSAHFLVDRDGTILQLMPSNVMARHVIGLNRVSVGIENVGGPRVPLTDAQADANAYLVRHLVVKYPNITHLIGHHEYGALRGTPLWQERDSTYFVAKQDPGAEFLKKVRARVADVPLRQY